MALNTRLSPTARNKGNDGICSQLDGGKLRVYSGAQPADPTQAASGVLLAEFALGTPAFDPSSAGVATATPIADTFALATLAAGYCRVLDAADVAYMDGSVGLAGCNLNLNSVDLQQNARVSVTDFTFQIPLQGA